MDVMQDRCNLDLACGSVRQRDAADMWPCNACCTSVLCILATSLTIDWFGEDDPLVKLYI